MRAFLTALVAAFLIAAPVNAATSISGPNEPGPYAIGQSITFTSDAGKLHGQQYPLIYLQCVAADSRTVYGQLDTPATVFVLGGGSSPWIDPNDPDYLAPATCTGYLYAYTPPGKHQTITLLAQTAPFNVP